MYRVPRATYRLQFNAGFPFDDARRIAGYLADLGVTDLYASPILKARRGSTHGYDVVDANSLNPELGTEEDFAALHAELQRLQLGFLLDVVPNHMAASPENAWWMSVLENGPQSRFIHYFDIERLEQKILLPILGRPYGEALEAGEIRLGFEADGFFFRYYDHRLPLAPHSYRQILRDCADSLPTEGVAIELRELVAGEDAVANSRFLKETLWRIYEQDEGFRGALQATIERLNGSVDDLDRLLEVQHYRLAYWRIASEKINYRRFFDVTDLVGLRVENPEVFEARNRRTLELIAEGKVTGLRIDHIDGLHDPVGHMRKLQLRLGEPELYVIVEKILSSDEQLPPDFPVAGTTGYDFLDALDAVFVDSAGLELLRRFYRRFTGVGETFEEICYQRKKQVIAELFSGEMRALGKQLAAVSMADRNARDFAPGELATALTEVTAAMTVYRTYIRDAPPSASDIVRIRDAVARARARAGTSIDERLFAFIERVLLADPPEYIAAEREKWLGFVMRWQQFTGRVMAKGVEDTAFYNYNVLVSLNEVGGNPGRGGSFDGAEEFHRHNESRQRQWPHTLNATATHDTKRSEDVRARINVLSELAEPWEKLVKRWSARNVRFRQGGAPDANEELLIYQTLVGMWPLEAEELETVPARLRQYLEKALREAKTHSSWIAPNPDYEHAVLSFADALLGDDDFRAELLRFHKRVAFHGFLNSLAQVVLKATAPGVPDFYQGTELWDFSLVDPDNRRPVDYEKRQALLKKIKTANVASLLRRWFDGRVKMFVTWKALECRGRHAELFRDGSYTPLQAGEHAVAFLRGDAIAVVVPRLMARRVKPGVLPLGEAVWGDAALELSGSWRNVFTDEVIEDGSLAKVFATFPVAILERR